MKKKYAPIAVLLCMLTFLSVCLSGCSGTEKGFPVAVSDADRSMYELTEKKCKDSELFEIYEMMASGKELADVHKQYEVCCLRKDDEGYHVIYVGKNRVLVLYFDSEGNWIERDKLESLYYTTRTRGHFDKLQKGDPISKVQYADPYCFFPFLNERGDHPLESDHYTQDGYHTHITYDEDLNIRTIEYDIA